MVKFTVLSAIFFAGAIGLLPTTFARPQEVDASPTAAPGSASTATPNANTKADNNLPSSITGVEAVVNTYNLADELLDVHLMLPGVCYRLPYSKAKLTYKKGLQMVRAYTGSDSFCNCTGVPSLTIFQMEDRMYGVPDPYWCMNLL
ncbi:hypothetical protein B0T25DRAFT_610646 [Lasiosphaeria hispida]|uniref:Uncharacterized protein n=1 Tax=Lasiosphaeria hispida TaxID=260671 RepID=A0AAJ0MCK7_9PEZI|nr:hypothetical protein B0T25DRAFT_610646 [Lasiosphaeria hispida]